MNCTNFYKWIDQYRLGRINVSDSQRSGQPLLQWKCQCSDGKPKWHAFSRRLKNTVSRIAVICNVRVLVLSTLSSIINRYMYYKKHAHVGFPKLLTEHHKTDRLTPHGNWKALWGRCRQIFNRIVTCDGTLFYFHLFGLMEEGLWERDLRARKMLKLQCKSGLDVKEKNVLLTA